MRYVFIVQGEGRGHLTQAISMERLLRENGHEVAAILGDAHYPEVIHRDNLLLDAAV